MINQTLNRSPLFYLSILGGLVFCANCRHPSTSPKQGAATLKIPTSAQADLVEVDVELESKAIKTGTALNAVVTMKNVGTEMVLIVEYGRPSADWNIVCTHNNRVVKENADVFARDSRATTVIQRQFVPGESLVTTCELSNIFPLGEPRQYQFVFKRGILLPTNGGRFSQKVLSVTASTSLP